MNIIISSLTSEDVRIVGNGSYDIDYLKVFISKTLEITPASLELAYTTIESDMAKTYKYSLKLIKAPHYDKDNYYAYQVNSICSIPEYAYNITFKYITQEQEQNLLFSETLTVFNALEDEHEPVMIIGRNINPVTTTIVAGDVNSQQIRFYIKKCYDGVSFLDESKEIYVDYIPVNFTPPENAPDLEFYSSKITEISDADPESEEGDWILLKWRVPPDAMAAAGSVTYGISVLSNTDKSYVWQTVPSTFTVLRNIGLRGIPVESSEEATKLSELLSNIDSLQEDVDNLNELVGNQADEDIYNDEEIIFIGGGAVSQEG